MGKIAVVGAGYVGLVTAACFAEVSNLVIVIEKDLSKVEALRQGKIPFYEPGLDVLVKDAIENKKIVFAQDIEFALLQEPKIIFSCVGTPSLPDGSADLSAVWTVAQEVGKHLHEYCVFINKSTVPVGTTRKIRGIIEEQLKIRGMEVEFDVASNPEFLKEGDALNDFLIPDRVVVGVKSKRAADILRDLYKSFVKEDDKFLVMNPESAELTKYASNAMLATRISFMNQIALLADKVGADVNQVRQGMAKDERIGGAFLNAGIGYGGSCFPKDVRALVSTGKEYGQPMTLVNEVENINNFQRFLFVDKVLHHYGDKIAEKNIGIWGLAFKPETDDIRCAPSIDIIKKLLEKGAKITAYDSVAWQNIKTIFGDKINYANTPDEVLKESDCLLVLTEWKEFLNYKPKAFDVLKDKVVFDGRNCFDPVEMSKVGINYFNIGRNYIKKELQSELLESISKELRV
jgi:UDPglucose 6-dehydrogenase